MSRKTRVKDSSLRPLSFALGDSAWMLFGLRVSGVLQARFLLSLRSRSSSSGSSRLSRSVQAAKIPAGPAKGKRLKPKPANDDSQERLSNATFANPKLEEVLN